MSKKIENKKYVSRGGEKLEYALEYFKINVKDLICADFGCSTGGFTDCLLQNGAKKVYAIDTGYGVLDWNLRNDKRVVVMERMNAMYVNLPEKVDFISVDVSWTKQEKIFESIKLNVKNGGLGVILIKPHYEANRDELYKGKVKEGELESVLNRVKQVIRNQGGEIGDVIQSPILGGKGGNVEFLACLNF